MDKGPVPADVEASDYGQEDGQKPVKFLSEFVPISDVFALKLLQILGCKMVDSRESHEVEKRG